MNREHIHSTLEMNDFICDLPDFGQDVYRDIFSSEYVYDVIYNHPERIKKIQPILDKLDFIQNIHFVFTIIFDNFWKICEGRDNTYRYQLKRTLLNQTRNALSEIHSSAVAATLIGTDKVVVLLECTEHLEDNAELYAYQCAGMLRDYIMQRTTFSVSIGVSNYCSSPLGAWKAYEQSFRALSASFVLGYGNILSYKKQEISENALKQNEVANIAKRFAITITSQDTAVCRQHVDSLFQHLSIITADENYVKSYVVLVLSEVVQYCIRLGLNASELSQRLIIMIQKAFQAGTIGKLQEDTLLFLFETIGKHSTDNQNQYVNLNAAHAYIEQFHTDDISLQTLAKLCGYSDAYFCRAFKRAFGRTYTSFLIECRIDHAKQLLAEQKISISEISEIVGFHSFSYFCACFKKQTGKTPGEYRYSQRFKIQENMQ